MASAGVCGSRDGDGGVSDNGTAPLLISVEATAVLLGIGRGLAYQLVQENKLPHVRLGRRLLISRQALEQWVQREVGVNGGGGIQSEQIPPAGAKEG